MVDPFSAGALGALAITEGIKFLYGQAGEILKRRRERQQAAKEGAPAPEEPIPVGESPVLRGELEPMQLDIDAVEELADELKTLRARLNDYATGVDVPEDHDTQAVAAMQALRDALETITHQRITFTFDDEDRPASGQPVLTGTVSAKEIRGRVAGLEAGTVTGGELRGHVEAGTVEEGADVAGLRVRNVSFDPRKKN